MDREYIDSNGVIDRYILGQLSEREQVEFELYFLEHPAVLDEVEMARALQRGLEENLDQLGRGEANDTATFPPPLLGRLVSWLRSPVGLAMNTAATTVFALMLAFIVLPLDEQQYLMGGSAVFPVQSVWVGGDRAGGDTAVIEFPGVDTTLVIDVYGEAPFTVLLKDEAGDTVGEYSHEPIVTDSIHVGLNAGALKSGHYNLSIRNASGELVTRRVLRIVPEKQPAPLDQ